jgi:hypothetical protein
MDKVTYFTNANYDVVYQMHEEIQTKQILIRNVSGAPGMLCEVV